MIRYINWSSLTKLCKFCDILSRHYVFIASRAMAMRNSRFYILFLPKKRTVALVIGVFGTFLKMIIRFIKWPSVNELCKCCEILSRQYVFTAIRARADFTFGFL